MLFSKSKPFITAFLIQICMLHFTIFTVYAGVSSHILGTVGYQSAKEGVPLSLEFIPPEGLGPDITWWVEGLPEGAVFSSAPAFPGAEGFGMATRGGRGGRVIKVTNLNPDGPGSLHDALLVNEPRIIVFDVSGVIDCPPPAGEWLLRKSHRLYAANAPLTIAGQTAPGAGITINGQLNLTDGDGGNSVDDVILRFLRLRAPFHQGSEGDNLRAGGCGAVFDHISGAWGSDENFDFSNLRQATVQWCGVEESAGYGSPWDTFIDRDRDGMSDHWEKMAIALDENTLYADFVLDFLSEDDPDMDGATNLEEYLIGSNPFVPGTELSPEWSFHLDTDNDGMADWWEKMVIDHSDIDDIETLEDVRPEDDLDGDFSTNLEEFLAGTDPLKGPTHNFGMIFGYSGKDISLHHTFFAHHKIRAPLSGIEILDYRNNVIYNCDLGMDWHPLYMNQQRKGELFRTNMIGNYFKVGPNSEKLMNENVYYNPLIASGKSFIFSEDNYFDMLDDPQGFLDIFDSNRAFIYNGGNDERADFPFPAAPVTTHAVLDSYEQVLAHAGCLPKDAVTIRNVNEIKSRSGKWGKTPPDGGLMEGLSPEPPPLDTDNDGIPDEWETVHGLNPNDGDDIYTIVKWGDSVLTYNNIPVPGTENRYHGYAYIEYYINELADRLILDALYKNGLDETHLPGYNQTPRPVFIWSPDYVQAGDYEFTVHASDGESMVSETIHVRVEDVNRAPFIYHMLTDSDGRSISTHLWQTIEPGDQFFVKFHVQEPDGQQYEVHVENGPADGVLTETGQSRNDLKGGGTYKTYTYLWSPGIKDTGWSGRINLVVTDDRGDSYSQEVKLSVSEPSGEMFTIHSISGNGGTINPSGEIFVKEGKNISFFIQTKNDYQLQELLVDGQSVGKQFEYVFDAVSEGHTIEARFTYAPGTLGGLIIHLPFDGNMTDVSGYGNHPSIISEAHAPQLTTDRFGNPDSACDFDGLDDFILIPDNSSLDSDEYTVSAWIFSRKELSNGGSTGQYIVSKGWTGNSIHLSLNWDKMYTSGDGPTYSEKGVLSGLENKWVHLAVSKGPDGVAFYLNGELKGSAPGSPCESNDSDVKIGARDAYPGPGAFYFGGKMDDVLVFNKALPADEILNLYQMQGGATLPVPEPELFTIHAISGNGGSIIPNGDITVKEGEDISFSIQPDNGYQLLELLVDGQPVGKELAYIFDAVSKGHTIEARFENTLEKIGEVILHLPFDGNMTDLSGFANQPFVLAEKHAPQLTTDRFGNPDSAYDFDGLDDFILISDNSSLDSDEYTVSAWISSRKELGHGGSSGQYIISKGLSGISIHLSLNWDKMYTSGDGFTYTEERVLSGLENTWIHIAVSKGPDGVAFYLNGEPAGSAPGSPCEPNYSDIMIGAREGHPGPGAFYFGGKMDDVYVFNKALPADEIIRLYQTQRTQ
jgi:hypothetical protein